ncbi:MAG: hypothetical protein CME26_16475 [Gemmatimonadetes bacterium]|nr:hypothetical protein [Gemmatimonadota bacterium]|tara:strand:- start:1791 stop:2825 length:1035 start_codon:yes stop_codon:yes gene_type:complete
MLGLDLYNGSQSQLGAFRSVNRVDFPLLQRAGAGGIPWGLGVENIIVIDRRGTVQGVFGITQRSAVNSAVNQAVNDRVPKSSLTPASLDFGQTATVGTPIQLTLSIENTGNGSLEVSGISSGLQDVQADPPTLSVSPAQTREVSIILTPTGEGQLGRETLFVRTDDLDWSLPISPIFVEPAPPPVIALPESSIDLGTIEIGRSGSGTLRIRNDGQSELDVSNLTSSVGDLRFATRMLTIAPGETGVVSLTPDPDSAGPISGTIEIASNDPEGPIATVMFSAIAIDIPADARADFDGSGLIDFADSLGFAGAFGTAESVYDINENGSVDFADFLTFAQNFGRSVN